MSNEEKLLNALKSINGTLKRIEQMISAERHRKSVKEVASHAALGECKINLDKDFL